MDKQACQTRQTACIAGEGEGQSGTFFVRLVVENKQRQEGLSGSVDAINSNREHKKYDIENISTLGGEAGCDDMSDSKAHHKSGSMSSIPNVPPRGLRKDILTQPSSSVTSDNNISSKVQQGRNSGAVIRNRIEHACIMKENPAEAMDQGHQPQVFTRLSKEDTLLDARGLIQQQNNLDNGTLHLKSSELPSAPAHKLRSMNSPSSSISSSQIRQSKCPSGKPCVPDHDKRRETPNTLANTAENPSDGVFFAQYKGHPETLVVYRSPEERAANPERLNLDRRHLTVCPILKSEERVRLLNYQNNYIDHIRNLACLPNLIFLDLYNNCIECLSRDLECVPTLRVLMLGKNRIKFISHLEKLTKLDVLDLHSNTIAKVEHLGALSELRVLNLAGNRLAELDELGNLHSLTELNVRRNQIVKAKSLEELQSLQRVFLSNNRIQSFEAIACLFEVRFLMELSMDGNPIALQDPSAYRHHAIDRVKTLRHLDLKRVTDAERRAVALESQRETERRRTAEKHEMLELERRKLQAERHEAIRAAERQWIDQTGRKGLDIRLCSTPRDIVEPQADSEFSKNATDEMSNFGHEPCVCLPGCETVKRDPCGEHGISYKIRNGSSISKRLAETAACSLGDRTSSKRPQNHKIRLHGTHTLNTSLVPLSSDAHRARSGNDQAIFLKESLNSMCGVAPAIGYYEVEIGGAHRDERILQLYGEAWECLDSPKVVGSCTALVCRFVSVERIVEKLRPRARYFLKLRKITFGDNAIHTLRHVLHLAGVFQDVSHLVELTIESNPICSLSILRPLICTAFLNIRRFNGVAISDNDQSLHSAHLGSFCNRASNLDKDQKTLFQTDVHQRDALEVTKRIVITATTNALRAEENRRALDKFWPLSIYLLIEECLDHDTLCSHFFAREEIWL